MTPQRGLIRSKGYFWLASRPDWVGGLSGAGQLMNIEPVGLWWDAVPRQRWPDDAGMRAEIDAGWSEPYGDRYQEIVFIGQDMRRAEMESALAACLLNPGELDAGMPAWRALPDPFPRWQRTDEQAGAAA